jgi:hypothetical protein
VNLSTNILFELPDGGEAFTGDLAPENAIAEEDVKSRESWKLLRSRGAKVILSAHAPETEMGKKIIYKDGLCSYKRPQVIRRFYI